MMRSQAFFVFTVLIIATATFVAAKQRTDRGTGRIDGEDTDFELLKVIVLNRHGHRAPNLPFWTLCPNEAANRDKFKVMPEDLTALGYEEEFRCGVYIKDMYPDFVGGEFNRTLHFFQAAGEPRTLQSAMAISNGAFPSTKKDPSWVLPAHPNLIPVFSANQNREYWLNDIPCSAATSKFVKAWLPISGEAIAAEHRPLLDRVLSLCGTTDAAAKSVSIDLLIKLVVDGIVFEHDFGIAPLKGRLTPREFMQLRNVSNAFLFGKLYGADEQRTFTASEFPHFLVKSLEMFNESRSTPIINRWNDNQGQAWKTPLNIFVVHREMIYGMMFFFNWHYRAAGMAPGEVPAGTAYIFEVLRRRSNGDVYIRTKMWNPREGEIPVNVTGCSGAHLCTMEEFKAIYNTRVNRTGRWDQLCDFERPDSWFNVRK